jgi:hypothetical protein
MSGAAKGGENKPLTPAAVPMRGAQTLYPLDAQMPVGGVKVFLKSMLKVSRSNGMLVSLLRKEKLI